MSNDDSKIIERLAGSETKLDQVAREVHQLREVKHKLSAKARAHDESINLLSKLYDQVRRDVSITMETVTAGNLPEIRRRLDDHGRRLEDLNLRQSIEKSRLGSLTGVLAFLATILGTAAASLIVWLLIG